MKTLVLLLLPILSFAQQPSIDSLTSRINAIELHYKAIADSQETQFKSIRRNLVFSQNQYRTGTWIIVAGVAVSTFGGILASTRTKPDLIVPMGGAVVSFIGWIVQVDAHKYIRRAGTKPTPENNWGRPPYKAR